MQGIIKRIGILIFGLLLLSGCSSSEKEQTLEAEETPETTEVTEAAAIPETAAAPESDVMAETKQADDTVLDEGIDIQKSSKRISNSMANEVFEDVKKQISASHEAYGKCENYKFVISSEREKKDGRIWEKLWIYYDLIPVRKPEEDPLIIGMREARDTLSDKKQIVRADQYIDDWLAELKGNRQQQEEEPDMEYQVFLAWSPDGENYTLYYDTQVDGHHMQIPFDEYLKQHTEDYEREKEKGKAYLLEAISDS